MSNCWKSHAAAQLYASSPGYSKCWNEEKASEYGGHTSVTESGHPCLDWSYYAGYFAMPEDSFSHDPSRDATLNYCRDIDGKGRPWCYHTKNYYDRAHEYCKPPTCEGM